MSDTLQRFLFEQAPVRGGCVQLSATWQAILERHDYPEPVRNLLGEMMVAAVLLSSTLKMKGRLSLQMRGDGPLKFMLVECTNGRYLRGLAQSEEVVPDGFIELMGAGRLVITLEPAEGKERYQSIVNLTGNCLADVLRDYLQRSEQLDTHLWLSANDGHVGGLLIQKLPGTWNDEAEALWERVNCLSATIKDQELLSLSQVEIIHRLYHEEDVRVFELEPICFRCSCSRDRVSNMMRSLGYDEIHDILAEQGDVRVACEFCNQKYEFDAVDIEQVFIENAIDSSSSTRH